MFGLPNNFVGIDKIIYKNAGFEISQEFLNAINASIGFIDYTNLLKNGYVIALKNVLHLHDLNLEKNLPEKISAYNEMQIFLENLEIQLRLFKDGNVSYSLLFQQDLITKKLSPVLRFHRKIMNGQMYLLESNEIHNLNEQLDNLKIVENELTELALTNFKLSYDIQDYKTKFITLMTCLESIFNLGREQITHTVARHFSVIYSSNTKEFQDNYSRMKKLYGLRSDIVHRNIYKQEDLENSTNDLYNIVRYTIKYILPLKINKKELNKILNEKGF